MSGVNTGGSAFPAEGGEFSGLHADPGMTMREYYATAALKSGLWPKNSYEHRSIAEWCFDMADAMIAVSAKDTPNE